METPVLGPRRLSNHAMSLGVLFTTALVGVLVFFLAPPKRMPDIDSFLPNYYMFDSSAQRLAHKAMLCALALFGLLSPWSRTALGRLLGPLPVALINRVSGRMYSLPLAFSALLLPLYFWSHSGVGKDQFLLGLVLTAGIMLFGGGLAGNKFARILIGAALSLHIVGLLLLSLMGTYSFGGHLQHSLFHYYAVLGVAPIMATGGSPLVNCTFYYGLLVQIFMAISQQGAGLLPMGDYVLVIQVSLIVFTLLALLCYRLISPRRTLWALVFVGLWLPWMIQAGGDGITPPNSGLRFMGLPLALLVLLLGEKLSPRPLSLCLGVTAGLALLLNLETGICIGLGFCAYSIISERATRLCAMLQRLALLLLGCLATLALFIACYRLGLGRWPVAPSDILAYIKLFSSGFGGIPWAFDPLALVIFSYPAYLVARLTGVWLKAELSPRMRFKFAVAFIILVWMAYYANRAWDYSLYSHAFLFTYLIFDLLPSPLALQSHWQGFKALGRKRVPALIVVFIFTLGPSTMNYSLTGAKIVWRAAAKRLAYEGDTARMERFSGLWIHTQTVQQVRAQCRFLAQIPKEKRVFFVDTNQFLVQLESGRFFPLPLQDLWGESFTTEGLERNIAAVAASAPDVVLLGNDPTRRDFNEHVMQRLAPNYSLSTRTDEWLVLEPRAALAAP